MARLGENKSGTLNGITTTHTHTHTHTTSLTLPPSLIPSIVFLRLYFFFSSLQTVVDMRGESRRRSVIGP